MSGWQEMLSDPVVAGTYGFFAMVVLVVAIPVVAGTWQRIAKDREDAALKQSMIDRGMSAEEIERILRAKSPGK